MSTTPETLLGRILIDFSAAGQSTAQSSNLIALWLNIWRLTARHITSSSICRAACHLMTCFLESGLVQFADVTDLVEGMMRSVDLNGPAECDESAVALWTTLLVRRGRENLSSAHEISESVLRWLFNRWSPGTSPPQAVLLSRLTGLQENYVIVIKPCTKPSKSHLSITSS